MGEMRYIARFRVEMRANASPEEASAGAGKLGMIEGFVSCFLLFVDPFVLHHFSTSDRGACKPLSGASEVH